MHRGLGHIMDIIGLKPRSHGRNTHIHGTLIIMSILLKSIIICRYIKELMIISTAIR